MRNTYRLSVTTAAIAFAMIAGIYPANALPWEASRVPVPALTLCVPPNCGNLTQDARQPAPEATCTPPWCPALPTSSKRFLYF